MARSGYWLVTCLLVGAVSSRGEVIVAGYNGVEASVAAYPGDGDGDFPPLRRIAGASTLLEFTSSPAVDAVHDELFVAHPNPSRLVVFDLGANGNVAPLRTIEGPMSGIFPPAAVAIDLAHDEIFVLGNLGPNHVRVFARTADGDVAPVRSFTVPNTEPTQARTILYDPVHEEIYVAMADGVSSSVVVFDRLASGTPVPLRRIAGPSTLLSFTYGLALDPVHDELFVSGGAGLGTFAVRTFTRTANGDVAPVRSISGFAAFLSVQYVAYDSRQDELVIDTNVDIRFFPRTASGNVAPSRVLGGPMAGVDGVGGIAIAPDRLFEDGFEAGNTAAWSLTVP